MKRVNFVFGSLLLAAGKSVFAKSEEASVSFNAENTLDFPCVLNAISKQGKVAVVAESYPVEWKQSLLSKLVGRTLSVQDALQELSKAYDYEIIRKSSVFVLQKLYTKTEDCLSVGFEEMVAVAGDIQKLTYNVSAKNFRNLRHVRWSDPGVKQMCSEIKSDLFNTEIPIDNLTSSLYDYTKNTLWMKWLQNSWAATQAPLGYLVDKKPVRLDIAQYQSNDIDNNDPPALGAWRTTVYSSQIPGNPVTSDTLITVIPENFYTFRQSLNVFGDAPGMKIPVIPCPAVKTLGEVVKSFSTEEEPLAVIPMLAKKPVCAVGLENVTVEDALASLAFVYNLRIAKKENVKTLIRPTAGAVSVSNFWKVVSDVLPPAYRRMVFAPRPVIDPSKPGSPDLNMKIQKMTISAYENLNWYVAKNIKERHKEKNKMENLDFENESRYATIVMHKTILELSGAIRYNPVDLLNFDKGWVILTDSPSLCTLTFRYVDPQTGQTRSQTFQSMPR